MNNIISAVNDHLSNSDPRDIADFDDMLYGVRVCASFESYCNEIFLIKAEIMNSDWDLLYEDTAVLNSRLKTILNDLKPKHILDI
ncbi:MAG: hypothetical protein LBR26_16000 [Prevotella sp.]|jgi:hypothetical protein|nr:hypothetical protein [Prevotella sp.]